MIVKHILTADAGELSPWLDGRTDLAKYAGGFKKLQNFIVLPQGGVMKRPGLEAKGTIPGNVTGSALVPATDITPEVPAVPPSPTTGGLLIEFQISSEHAAMLALGGREIRIWQDGAQVMLSGNPYKLTIPWLDADLTKLRWKQINNVIYFVHGDYPMWKLTRYGQADWDIREVDHETHQPLLKENAKDEWKLTVNFPVNATATTWSSASVAYAAGARVLYSSKNWVCQKSHTSSSTRIPGASTYTELVSSGGRFGTTVTRQYWVETFTDESTVPDQVVDITSNLSTWESNHVGAVFEVAKKRTSVEYESIMRAISANNGKFSPVVVVQGGWTFQSYESWRGTWIIQRSEDRGMTWEEVRRYGSYDGQMRNASTEGEEEKRVLMRLKWEHAADPPGGSDPYAILSASNTKIRGLVRIKEFINDKTVKAVTISPVEKGTTQYWSEGAWSKVQGYPSCIETHQARLVVAATKLRPHSVWGSAVDDYPNFHIGLDADEAYFHTVPVGERDPILWLVSERQLLVGTGSGEFIMAGETEDGAITPEFGTARRQSSHGSHDGGAAAIFSDSVAMFIQRGGTRVREYSYRFEQDRYEASNLNILADHLFDNQPVSDVAVQRMPFQVVWFVSGGKLYGLTYERQQQVVAWHRHDTQGEILSVASLRTAGSEDEIWLLVKRSGVFHVERFRPGALTNPANDGNWKDGTAGLAYTAIYQPMTPDLALANGSSRSREFRIHRIVPSLYRSRGGKYGQTPEAALYPLAVGSASELFTGETEKGFSGTYSTNDGFCIVSDEPHPFAIRSTAVKFNVLGDEG